MDKSSKQHQLIRSLCYPHPSAKCAEVPPSVPHPVANPARGSREGEGHRLAPDGGEGGAPQAWTEMNEAALAARKLHDPEL